MLDATMKAIPNLMELQITTHESERLFGSVVYVYTANVDALFAKYKSRGLETNKPGSHARKGPTDET